MERRTSRALHLGTKNGAGRWPTPCARSSARVEETSGAGAPSSAVRSQNHGRDQHKSHPLGYESSRSHKQGNACLSQTPVVVVFDAGVQQCVYVNVIGGLIVQGSPRGLQKLALNSGTTRRSAKNASEPPKTPSHRYLTASKNNVRIFKCELRRKVRVYRHEENK